MKVNLLQYFYWCSAEQDKYFLAYYWWFSLFNEIPLGTLLYLEWEMNNLKGNIDKLLED